MKIKDKIKPNKSQRDNIDAIKDIDQIDISVKGLSRRVNKEIDENFNKAPTSKNFITTNDKGRGIITYPLLLLTNITENSTLDILKERFESLRGGDKNISVMYRRGNKAIVLCNTRNVPEVEEILLDYCVDYNYFISKGEKSELNLSANFDFSNLELIEDIEEFIPYKESLEEQEVDKDLMKKIEQANLFIDKIMSVTNESSPTDNKEQLYKEIGLVQVKADNKDKDKYEIDDNCDGGKTINGISTDYSEEMKHEDRNRIGKGTIKSF